jgi:hypothetical protein
MTAEVPMSDARDLKGETGFAVTAVPFRVRSKKFPVLIAGNSSKEASCFNGFVQVVRAFRQKFPVFSRLSGNSSDETRSL